MWSHSQTRGGFPPGPRSSLRESVITRSLRTLPSSHGRLARWVPRTRSRHFARKLLWLRDSLLLESLESHTQSCTDTWRHSCQAAAGRIPHLPTADRSRTCLLRCSAHALETEQCPVLSQARVKSETAESQNLDPPTLSTFLLSVGPSRPSASSAASDRVRALELNLAPPGNLAAPASRTIEVTELRRRGTFRLRS